MAGQTSIPLGGEHLVQRAEMIFGTDQRKRKKADSMAVANSMNQIWFSGMFH
jgi:hypothetical protein